MNWLRGPKKREITPNSPPPVAEEVSSALLVISKERDDLENLLEMRRDSDAPHSRYYIPSSPSYSRVASPTFRDAPPLAIEVQPSTQPLQITSGKEYENNVEYMLPPLEDNIEAAPEKVDNKETEAPGPNAGRKKSPKLRISALNILKVKGTSFRSKTPDEEGQQRTPRRRDSVVCLLPFAPFPIWCSIAAYRTHALPIPKELPSQETTQLLVDRIQVLRVGDQHG